MEGDSYIFKKKSHSLIVQYVSVAIAVAVVVIAFQLIQQSEGMTFFQFFLPVPAIVIALRYSSLWSGIATITFSTAMIAIFTGYRTGILFFLGTGIVAIILSVCFLRKYSATATISWMTFYYVVLGIIVVYMQEGITFEVYTQRLLEVFKEQFVSLYENQDIAWQNFEAQFEALAKVLSMTFPFMSAVGSSVIMYIVARTLLKLQRIALRPLGRFQDWQISEYMVWVFILGGSLYHLEATRIVGINILLGFVFLYYLQGCAVITYILKQRRTAKFLQFIAYILLFLQLPYIFVSLGLLLIGYTQGGFHLSLPAVVLVAGIGLANVWIDFRKRLKQKIL
jgi:hypothetical protein